MKPYAVNVTIGGKTSGKEFDTEAEFTAFLGKAEELKKKAPTLLVKIVRNGIQPKKKSAPKKKTNVIYDDRKEESIAWIRVNYSDGTPMVSGGKQLYKSVPVPPRRGTFYCPYCCGYKEAKQKVDLGYGLHVEGCSDCGATMSDFHVKIVNNLWKVK